MSRAVLAQLYALRAQVDAVIVAIEGEIVVPVPACQHPVEGRRDTSTAGGPRMFLCLTCNTEVEGVA